MTLSKSTLAQANTSHAQKIKMNWQPSASLDRLNQRANIIKKIRQFFEVRDVLEVETPLLDHSTATDPHINSFSLQLDNPSLSSTEVKDLQTTEEGTPPPIRFLQTSPEFSMKKLLAAGSGPIFQMCKAFRKGEYGNKHHPEFTLLEWYRPGFDHFELMSEVDKLLQAILDTPESDKISYENLFQKFLNINPHQSTESELKTCAQTHSIKISEGENSLNKDDWLNLLLTHCIEPHLSKERPLFLYHYPPSQAALSKIITDENDNDVAARFETYVNGIELANGYFELTDAKEQQRRFVADNQKRKIRGLTEIPIDQHLIDALEYGLPECAGVALGIDRLIMLATGATKLSEVIAFT